MQQDNRLASAPVLNVVIFLSLVLTYVIFNAFG